MNLKRNVLSGTVLRTVVNWLSPPMNLTLDKGGPHGRSPPNPYLNCETTGPPSALTRGVGVRAGYFRATDKNEIAAKH